MDSKRGPFQPGDRFLKWEIRSLIGKGGHAYVYEAHDPFLSLDVAIKVIPSSRDTGRDLVARARSEARVLIRISHPNVVKIMDAGATDDGIVYLVMEKLSGRDLRKALRQYGRLTPIETLRIAVQVAEAVAAAHAVGAIHRDLKPENIFLCPDHLIKVLDFGIAKVMGYGAPTTQKDLLHGTVLYMPPEQLKGFGVTARSDIFSLGTLLYESLHHHPALLGKEVPTVQELGWIQIERMPPMLDKVDQSIPPHVARFVQRAIMKNPDQRYASMAEMAEAARAALDRLAAEAGSKKAPRASRDLSIEPDAEATPAPEATYSEKKDAVSPTQDTELISGSVPPPPPPSVKPAVSSGSETQLTPPPTISLIAEKPATSPGRLGAELPWRKLAAAGSIAGLGLGVVYALMDVRRPSPHGSSSASSAVVVARGAPSTAANDGVSASPTSGSGSARAENGAPADAPPPALSGSREPGATANAPETATGPSAVAAKPQPAASARPALKPLASAKAPSRSAMDERLEWLERDLKGKNPATPSSKRARPDVPASGSGQ